MMAISRILCASMFGLIVASSATAEIYKWVDEQGNVHYGDCPPADCASDKIDVAPGPSDQAVQEAQDRLKRLREHEKSISEERKAELQREEAEQTAKPPVWRTEDPACFTSLVDAWGGQIADTRESVSRIPLTDAEYRQLENILGSLEGRWSGTVDEITCIRPDATQPKKTDRYSAHLGGRWKSRQVFEVETDLTGVDSGAVLREFVWFLLSKDGLRFRKATTDISFNIDQPANDVETLTVGSNSVLFFWRRGGALRKANVFELRKEARGFRLREFFYVQGTLAGKRVWKINR